MPLLTRTGKTVMLRCRALGSDANCWSMNNAWQDFWTFVFLAAAYLWLPALKTITTRIHAAPRCTNIGEALGRRWRIYQHHRPTYRNHRRVLRDSNRCRRL